LPHCARADDSVLIIFEMTRGYGLVLPLMIANMSAFALARHWRRTALYDALLEQDGIHLHGAPEPVEIDSETHAETPLFADAKDRGTFVE